MLKRIIQGAAFVTALFLLVGCGASKKNHESRLILQGADSQKYPEVVMPDHTIQKGDLLTIMIFSDNKEATEIYNQPQSGGAAAGGGNVSNLSAMGRGYQVDPNGQIYLHSIGLVRVEGMTKKELVEQIQERLKPYLMNPYVTVRFTNPRINVLGEVFKPGVFELPDQKISILDAIGLAGDLTPFSRRDNVLIIREQDGKRISGRLDLRSTDIYGSPFFYLQQNDLVYVEPTRKKPTGSEQVLMRNIAIGTSILSVVTILISILTR